MFYKVGDAADFGGFMALISAGSWREPLFTQTPSETEWHPGTFSESTRMPLLSVVR